MWRHLRIRRGFGVALVAVVAQVLVVTFTNAATQELNARIRKALVKAADACERGTSTDPTYRELGERHGEAGAKILRTALQQCDEMSVATIHSFCKRAFSSCSSLCASVSSTGGMQVAAAAARGLTCRK